MEGRILIDVNKQQNATALSVAVVGIAHASASQTREMGVVRVTSNEWINIPIISDEIVLFEASGFR